MAAFQLACVAKKDHMVESCCNLDAVTPSSVGSTSASTSSGSSTPTSRTNRQTSFSEADDILSASVPSLIATRRARWADIMDDDAETAEDIMEVKEKDKTWEPAREESRVMQQNSSQYCPEWYPDCGYAPEQAMFTVTIEGLPAEVYEEQCIETLLEHLGMSVGLVCYEPTWNEVGTEQLTLTYADYYMASHCTMYFQRCFWGTELEGSLTVNMMDLSTNSFIGIMPQTFNSAEFEESPAVYAASKEEHMKARVQAHANALSMAAGLGVAFVS